MLGSKKVPSGSPRQVDSLPGQETFKANLLPNGQRSRQVILLQHTTSLTKKWSHASKSWELLTHRIGLNSSFFRAMHWYRCCWWNLSPGSGGLRVYCVLAVISRCWCSCWISCLGYIVVQGSMSKCRVLLLAGRSRGCGSGYRSQVRVGVAGKNKSPNLTNR